MMTLASSLKNETQPHHLPFASPAKAKPFARGEPLGRHSRAADGEGDDAADDGGVGVDVAADANRGP